MRGDGDVFVKPGSRFYHYVFWVDGRRVRGSTGEVDEERARRMLRRKLEDVRRGDAVPGEERLMLADLLALLRADYRRKRNRSAKTMESSFKNVVRFFGEKAKVVKLGDRLDDYEEQRRREGASDGTIRIELALLDHACKLAVQKKRLSPRSRPFIEKPPE